MPDLFDFGFDDPAPGEAAPAVDAPEPVQAKAPTPAKRCKRPKTRAGYACRVGGGDACFSDDMCRTWFCREHAPEMFFAAARHQGAVHA